MIYIYSSNIQTGKFEEFSKWAASGLRRYAQAQPKSWKLKGVYLTAFGLGTRHVEVHWEIENYSAFDNARAEVDKKSSEFTLFLSELHSFLDPATGSGRLLKHVATDKPLVVGC